MINVVIASSFYVLREGIRAIIEPHKYFRVCGEATSMQEILGSDDASRDKIVIVAAPLHCVNDEEIRRVVRERASLQLIMIARGNGIDDVRSALNSGARGMLTRSCPKENLLQAARVVSAGRLYVSEEMAMLIASSLKSFSSPNFISRLTERELEVLKRVAIGRRMATIGNELKISSKTVSAHKANIMEKLAITSDSELVVYAMKNQLFDLFVDHSTRKRHRP